MRGRVIFVNPPTKTGLIFGANRQRYEFALEEWRESTPLRRNQEVNFQTDGNRALRLKAFTLDYTDEPIAPALSAKAKPAPGGRPTPTLDDDPAAPADEPYFDDGIDLPPGLPGEEAPLTAGRGRITGTGAGGVRGAGLSQRIFLEQDGSARPASWKLYLIGTGAAFAFVLIVYIVTLFTHHR
jgi:hypothetical protein